MKLRAKFPFATAESVSDQPKMAYLGHSPLWRNVVADRITKKIRAMAEKNGWEKPHWEVGPLIRDLFTDEVLEQMGLWYIVAMHEPIDSGGDPDLLGSGRGGGGRWLGADYDTPDFEWRYGGGFGFVIPQVSSQTSVT